MIPNLIDHDPALLHAPLHLIIEPAKRTLAQRLRDDLRAQLLGEVRRKVPLQAVVVALYVVPGPEVKFEVFKRAVGDAAAAGVPGDGKEWVCGDGVERAVSAEASCGVEEGGREEGFWAAGV